MTTAAAPGSAQETGSVYVMSNQATGNSVTCLTATSTVCSPRREHSLPRSGHRKCDRPDRSVVLAGIPGDQR
jgi:hypothetical protein